MWVPFWGWLGIITMSYFFLLYNLPLSDLTKKHQLGAVGTPVMWKLDFSFPFLVKIHESKTGQKASFPKIKERSTRCPCGLSDQWQKAEMREDLWRWSPSLFSTMFSLLVLPLPWCWKDSAISEPAMLWKAEEHMAVGQKSQRTHKICGSQSEQWLQTFTLWEAEKEECGIQWLQKCKGSFSLWSYTHVCLCFTEVLKR